MNWCRVDADGLPTLFTSTAFASVAGAGAAALLLGFLLMPFKRRHRVFLAMSHHGVDTVSHIVNKGFVWVREILFRPLMALVIKARYPVMAAALLASVYANRAVYSGRCAMAVLQRARTRERHRQFHHGQRGQPRATLLK